MRRDIERQLFWSPFVDENQVVVGVDAGRVTLTGTADSWRERDAAMENAFEGGAVYVENRLNVKDRG